MPGGSCTGLSGFRQSCGSTVSHLGPTMPALCNVCGRHVGHSGVWVTSGFYAGLCMCADVAVTARQRRVLESCCLPAHMPVLLEVFITHPDLNLVLGRFLNKFGRYEKACAFARFFLTRLQMPARVSDAILGYLIPL